MLITGADGYLGACVELDAQRVGTRCEYPQHDVVVHLGWRSKPGDSEPELQKGCLTRTLALAATGARIVFASTVSVYGVGDQVCNELSHCDPKCAYTRAKLAAEYAVRFYNPNSCVLRFGSLMGRGAGRTKTELVVNAFCTGPIECWNPHCWKPVIHVRDAAEVVRRATVEGWSGTYNVASATHKAWYIAKVVSEATGKPVKYVEDRNGARGTRVDCAKLMMKAPMHWRTLEETVEEMRGYTPTAADATNPW